MEKSQIWQVLSRVTTNRLRIQRGTKSRIHYVEIQIPLLILRSILLRRFLDCLLFAVFSIIVVGCNPSFEQPNPPVANALENTSVPRTSTQAIPTATIQQSALSPIGLPTVTSAPLVIAEPTSLPYPPRYTTDGTLISVTPVPAAPQLTCTPQGEVIACNDELLDMTFSYPAFMGPLLYTILQEGGYSGYAYEYIYKERESYAGGRSSDYSIGRGPRYTDQGGFGGQDVGNLCAAWVAAICQELGSSALLIVMLPQAERLCSDAMMFQPVPRGILVLDLPQHPLIHGFSFSFELMSAEAAEAFQEEWYMHGRACKPETKAELGAAMNQLQLDLQAGNAATEIQQR
jgi:hypothetical protein